MATRIISASSGVSRPATRAHTRSGARSWTKSSSLSSMKLNLWCSGPSEMIEVGPCGSPTCIAVGTSTGRRKRKSHTIHGSENP